MLQAQRLYFLTVVPKLILSRSMELKVAITSMEMIKPSSPTPDPLRTLNLSFLDQMSPPIYIPFIFFYQANQDDLHPSLKASLSDVLTQFYPLAGRFSSGNFTVDCNDSGALFVETKVDANLLEFIRDPAMGDLDKLLPLGRVGSSCILSEDNTVVLAVQTNLFDDGGIAVAAQVYHNTADAISLANFMNAWAAASRGGEFPSPTFGDLATSYPPRDMSTSGFESTYGIVPEKIVTKRTLFDKDELQKIKQAETEASQVKDATRVEAISAYFMRRFKDAARAKGSKKPVAVMHFVNLRQRVDPALPYHAFGNLCMVAHGSAAAADDDVEDMVAMLRTAIKKCDGHYVEELHRDGDEYFRFFKKAEISCITCDFSSLFRLPFYEADFGWGRPVWVSPARLPYKNQVTLMPASSGDAMEAWVGLLQEDAD